ncbi:exported hypothetical protein [Rhodospirillaceae bacterium LM-1]|nr:exported hypothetical protein [Rhodospirillaceae bacterium LM-1]
MTEGLGFHAFWRASVLCLLSAILALMGGAARAEGDEPPKLTKAEKAYIQRMIEHGKEEKQYPDKRWMYQGCRLNMHGTWYPFDRFSESWLGRMVITGDSIIFEKVGEIPYVVVKSEYGPEVPPGGALPRRERHIFELSKSVYTGSVRKQKDRYLVIAHPPWSNSKKKPEHWIWRCVPDVALCPDITTALNLFDDKGSFDEASSGCPGFNFTPYTDD